MIPTTISTVHPVQTPSNLPSLLSHSCSPRRPRHPGTPSWPLTYKGNFPAPVISPPRNVSLKREKGNRQQIVRTRAKSQRIVAQRPLSRVQYPVLYLSRIQRICLSRYLNLLFGIDCAEFCSTTGPSPYYDLGPAETGLCLYIITSGKAHIAAFQHGFWLRGVQP